VLPVAVAAWLGQQRSQPSWNGSIPQAGEPPPTVAVPAARSKSTLWAVPDTTPASRVIKRSAANALPA
jgi:hypothetical protein